MTRYFVKLFGTKDIFSRKLLGLVEPAPHAGLRHSKVTRHLAGATRALFAELKGFVPGEFFNHEEGYTLSFNPIKRQLYKIVECPSNRFRIAKRHG